MFTRRPLLDFWIDKMSTDDYKKQRGSWLLYDPNNPPDDSLTFEQSENHRRMVEDMTGRKFKPRKQNL